MADDSDVRNALVLQIASILYPMGSGSPSITGQAIKIEAGWPNSPALTAQLAALGSTVTVFHEPGMSRNVYRYNDQQIDDFVPGVESIVATVSGGRVTFSGPVNVGQVVGVAIGDGPSPACYSYRVLPNDTDATIAAAFAGAIPNASAAGSVLTISTNQTVFTNVVADATSLNRVSRMQDHFRVTLWCPTPGDRDMLSAALWAALCSLPWLVLPDTTSARLLPVGGQSIDQTEGAKLYRRDLSFSAEYDITVMLSNPTALFIGYGVNGAPDITAIGGWSIPPSY